jgi:hypothetical protein
MRWNLGSPRTRSRQKRVAQHEPEMRREELQGDEAVHIEVPRLVNDSHAALAEPFQDLEVGDRLTAHPRPRGREQPPRITRPFYSARRRPVRPRARLLQHALELPGFAPALGVRDWAASHLATSAERLAQESRRFQQGLRRIQLSFAKLTDSQI